MTCKDCYLYEGCIVGHMHCYDEEGIKKNCKSFKDKNNYVEVIRCRDCVHFKDWGDCLTCKFWTVDYDVPTTPDGYCSYAVRIDREIMERG